MVTRAAAIALGLSTFAFLVASCGNYGGPFNFDVVNNLTQTVVLRQCANPTCTESNEPWTIKAGQVGDGFGVPDGILRSMKVFSASKKVLGCLPFRFTGTPPSNIRVDLSEMVPCGDSGGARTAGRHDWPALKR
jgi:hypothetical protein